jgi:hypothetical protein
MTLPTFLGIGVPRAGTTWLYELLDSHPEVYVPARRKEVSFFDRFYNRGIQWYAQFFPKDDKASQFQAIGEITPHYFFCPECPERIARIASITRLLLILREPADRAYSYFKHIAPIDNYSKSFEDFLCDYPEIVQEGFYSKYLENYLRHFGREQLLILIYEQAMGAVPQTRDIIARFLDVDSDRFPPGVGTRVVNKSYNPQFRRAYAIAANIDRRLREGDMDWLVNLAIGLGIKKSFGKGDPPSPMKEQTRCYLKGIYADEIRELELLLEIDLQCWK